MPVEYKLHVSYKLLELLFLTYWPIDNFLGNYQKRGKMVYNYTKPRRPVMASFRGPGPCYALPGLVGEKLPHDPRSVHLKGPAYSFRLKHGKWQDDCSPGPKYALDSKMLRGGKEERPHYSITGRPRDIKSAKTPGPAAYSPEKSGQQAYYRHPTYAFGMRHKGRSKDNTPGKV